MKKKGIKIFIHRLVCVWKLLTKRHCILIAFEREDLIKVLTDQDYDLEMYHVRLRPYIVKSIIKNVGESLDADEMILEKAEFEAGIETYNAKQSFNFFEK